MYVSVESDIVPVITIRATNDGVVRRVRKIAEIISKDFESDAENGNCSSLFAKQGNFYKVLEA
ncbi:hypothetical protein GCM10027568_34250 [Humibacter soli]